MGSWRDSDAWSEVGGRVGRDWLATVKPCAVGRSCSSCRPSSMRDEATQGHDFSCRGWKRSQQLDTFQKTCEQKRKGWVGLGETETA